MKIGILGAGNVGTALAAGWLAKGHDVLFGVPRPDGEKTRAALAKLGPRARAGSPREAASFGEALVVATPWGATREALAAAGDLSGKLVLDATNPLEPDLSGLEVGHTTSGGERVASWAPGAKVFKVFNQTGANVMADPAAFPARPVMFVAGDDPQAKPRALALARDLGFEAIDAGPLRAARLLEPLAMLWISLAYAGGLGRDFAFALVRPGPRG